MSIIINPTLTTAGQAAAIAASDDGFELQITHVTFGGGHYDPTGNEVALQDEFSPIIPIAGGTRPTPTQIRISSVWRADTGTYPIGEVGIWAGSMLFAVWSKADGTLLITKTPGVDFVLFNDLSFKQVPPNSFNVVIDPDASAALAALTAHEGADNAHPQYVRHDEFPDAQANLWMTVGGTGNALELTTPSGVFVTGYAAGQVFRFKATAANTGVVTASINGIGALQVRKSGSIPLLPADIRAGAVYDLICDGTYFQLAGGVGSDGFFARYEHVATEGQTEFAAIYTPGSLLVLVNGREIGTDSYTASDGANVELGLPCSAGDEVQVIAFSAFSVANTYTKGEYDAKHASQAEAEAGESLLKWMSPGRVFQALRSAAAAATETLHGVLRVGTQGEVDAGALDDVAVTPKKLRWGFTTWDGGFVLPTWLGGYAFQWGIVVAGSEVTTYFPVAFPTTCLFVIAASGYTVGSGPTQLEIFGVGYWDVEKFISGCSSPTQGGLFIAVGK